MGFFTWLFKQVNKQINLIQQAEEERLQARKKWLANPYGMDPELQQRLVAEATKKREDEMAYHISQLPEPFDPHADFEGKLAEHDARKSREEEEQKKSDAEFEVNGRERIALQRSKVAVTGTKVSSRSAPTENHKEEPVQLTSSVNPDRVITTAPAAPAAPTADPMPVPSACKANETSETIEKIIAQIQAVKPLGDIIFEQSATPCVNTDPAITLTFRTPNPVLGSLAFLRNDPEFLEIRDAIQRNHELLSPFIEKIKSEDPQLALLLFHNEEEFRSLLAETSTSVNTIQPPDLQFLEYDQGLLNLRRKIQQDPSTLGWAMRKLAEERPDQVAIFACNEAHFFEWLNVGSPVRIGPVAGEVDSNADAVVSEFSALNFGGALNFLRGNQEFRNIRATYHAKPEMLQWLARELVARSPDLKAILVENEAEFIQLMNEGFVPPIPISDRMELDRCVDQIPLSPLSQSNRQAEENTASKTGDNAKKKVRFTDSAIHGDNNVDFSSPIETQSTQPTTQSEEDLGTPQPMNIDSTNDIQEDNSVPFSSAFQSTPYNFDNSNRSAKPSIRDFNIICFSNNFNTWNSQHISDFNVIQGSSIFSKSTPSSILPPSLSEYLASFVHSTTQPPTNPSSM